MAKRIKECKKIPKLAKGSILVFLKGFAARLVLDEKNMGVLDVAMRCIPYNANGFVWDGDDYSTTSYSGAVLSLMERYPQKLWIAAKKKSEQKQFYDSWQDRIPANVTVHLILFDDQDWPSSEYFRLGIAMYEKALQAKVKYIEIFCLGGGTASMTHEFKADKKIHALSKFSNYTRWYLFLFTRKSADGTQVESTFNTGTPNSFLAVEDWKK